MLAFKAAPRLSKIAKSEAMRPWRLNTEYDRPIPRRIAEEAGVPRELFGQKKQAAAMLIRNGQKVGPDLFELQTRRYGPAARALNRPRLFELAALVRRSAQKLWATNEGLSIRVRSPIDARGHPE